MANNIQAPENLLSIKSDLAFRAVFGREEDACKGALKAFLEAVLGIKIHGLSYTNPLNFQEYATDKKSEMDIEIITDTQSRIDVEIQRNKVEGFDNRMTYYANKLSGETIGHGQDWATMKPVKVVSILEYVNFTDEPTYLHSVRLIRMPGCHEFGNLMEIIFLELPKLPQKTPKDMSELERWLFFMDHVGETSKECDIQSILQQIISESEGIKMAYETLIEISADERMRSKIRSQEIAERDYITRLHTAERVGIEKGMEKGIRGFISAMQDFNIPAEAILSKLQEKYGLSESEASSWFEKVSQQELFS